MSARHSALPLALLVPIALASGPGCGDSGVEPRTPLPREDTGLEPEPLPERAAISDCPKTLEGTIDVDRTITAGCEVSVPGHVSVDGATLTIESGATLRFGEGAGMIVSSFQPGRLVVEGTETAPVVMTAAGNADARWAGLTLGSGANGSALSDLRLEQGPEGRVWLTIEAEQVTRTRVVDRAVEAPPADEDAGAPPPAEPEPGG